MLESNTKVIIRMREESEVLEKTSKTQKWKKLATPLGLQIRAATKYSAKNHSDNVTRVFLAGLGGAAENGVVEKPTKSRPSH